MAAANWRIDSEPQTVRDAEGRRTREVWPLPAEEAFLEPFLRQLFEKHWQGLVFGPLIQGAAYEFRCPSAPRKITLFDGYLTVHFGGGGHFHLCIGENMGSDSNPTPAALRAHRKPSKAQLFRGFGRDGKPLSWGFEMWNGKDEPMISVFFPNPFLTDDDRIADAPDFSRLSVWRAVARTWLGREPEALDEEGRGFGGSH